jgi:hypothetical protein
MELVDFLSEILDRRYLPDGSVILIGSASYLSRVGTSIYAREWTLAVDKVGRKWPNARIGPLTPVIRTDSPGGIARELIELASWFAKMYVGRHEGFLDSWNVLVPKIMQNSEGHINLPLPESYTVSLPSSLAPNYLDRPSTFVSQNSRPSVLKGADKGTVGEILNSVAAVLHRDFNIKVSTSVPLTVHLRTAGYTRTSSASCCLAQAY